MKLTTAILPFLLLGALIVPQAQSTRPPTTAPAQAGATPLLLEKNEGETRLWRPEPSEGDIGGFILKVTPKANGSQHLVLIGGEDMRPGDAIPSHKHLEQDEIVLIEKGTIHAHVGDQEREHQQAVRCSRSNSATGSVWQSPNQLFVGRSIFPKY